MTAMNWCVHTLNIRKKSCHRWRLTFYFLWRLYNRRCHRFPQYSTTVALCKSSCNYLPSLRLLPAWPLFITSVEIRYGFHFWLFSALTWWHIDTHRPLLENREWAPLEEGWQPEGQESDPLSGLLRHLLASGWPEWWWPCWPRVFLWVRTFSSLSPPQVCKHISSGGLQIYLVKIRAHVVSLNLWLEAFCLEEEDL